MRKYRFTITAKIAVSKGENTDIFKVEFFADDLEKAEKFRDELDDLYFKTNNPFRPQIPFPRSVEFIEITDEPDLSNIVTVGAQEW